jgi:DNA-binding NarL/FixJ family response regulator
MRSILADSEPAVRRALRLLLTHDLDIEVVGEVGTPESLQGVVTQQQPDLLVVDWELLASSATAALASLREISPGLRVVVLGLAPEVREAALVAGADAFVSKVDAPDSVRRALHALLAGHSLAGCSDRRQSTWGRR